MKRFDLFEYLGQKDNEEATIYKCGYYVINKHTNKLDTEKAADTFYTFIDNTLLKFDMIKMDGKQYFNVYEIKTFQEDDWVKIDSLIARNEDVDECMIDRLLDLENYDPFNIEMEDDEFKKIIKEMTEE